MRIIAVVVSCNARECLPKTLAALGMQVDACVVVDNASEDGTKEWLEEWQSQDVLLRHVMMRADKNLGKAQNEGIVCALAQGADAVLLMDHDSIAAPDMVVQLVAGFDKNPLIAMTAPYLLDVHSQRTPCYPRARSKWRAERVGFAENEAYLDGVMGVIASGSLVLRSTFEQIGKMDEGFAIDYIDKDFCLRVVRAGRIIRVVRAAVLHHQLGEARDYRVCGKTITSTNHTPDRVFTIFRNRVCCWKRHGRALPAFVIYDIAAAAYDVFKIIVCEQKKAPKLRAVIKGLFVGSKCA